MASVKSRFDANASLGALQESDGPWLTTYSRALCSIYPKDEEGCWDYLLSTQPSSIFSKQPDDITTTIPTAPSTTAKSRRVKRSGPAVEDSDRTFSATPSSSSPSSAPNGNSNHNNNGINSNSGVNSKYSEIGIALTSPAKLSHALCKIGFDCIDYFTATQDDLISEPPQPSLSRNSNRNDRQETLYTSPLLNELSDSDWRTGLAAAVGGKRAAALERKRALSRTMSQEEVMATATITAPTTLLYKPATVGNKKKGSAGGLNGSMAGLNGATGSSTTTPCNSSASATTSFMEFAGNSRYQAYNLARFSTLSAVSSSATLPNGSSRTSADSRSPEKGHDAQEGPSSSSHANRAHSNPAESDTQSPLSPSMGSSLPSSSSSSTTALPGSSSSSPASDVPASTKNQEDKDDDWAINESYSGHGGQTYSSRNSSIPPPGTSSNTASTAASQGDRKDDEDSDSRTTLQPSLSSFKSSSDIERSWRRTSDSLSSPPNSSASPTLSASLASKAGGLDLSSSTLVQQMLFRDRAPHSDVEDKSDRKQTKNEGNHAEDSAPVRKEDAYGHHKEDEQDRDDYGNHLAERKHGEDLIHRDQATADRSAAAEEASGSSPSLASMLLSSATPSLSSSTEEAAAQKPNKRSSKSMQDKTEPQEEEDHISKLDIRVGIVRSVSGHPDADSLYIEQVDVGDREGDEPKEARTIVSGLVRHVPKEYLEGRAVIVVANMKPSKLRGVMSQGMLLCAMEQDASGEVTKVALLEPAEGSQAGDKVTFEGFTDEDSIPAAVLTPKRKWFEKSRVHFSVQDGIAYYKGSPFRTVKGLVRCRSISKGQIS
ncbi:hypothetical protein EC968_001531 [Mortierella alpina]|nr:hypothetical protein EC968_001531 [Mortierella alpina]